MSLCVREASPMDPNSRQQTGNSPPTKPWERAGTSSSGPTPFKPPSPGSTSDVVEASGTARPGEIVSTSEANTGVNRNSIGRPLPTRPWEQQTYGSMYGGYGSGLSYNSGYGSGTYGSSYGGFGGSYGGGLYGNNTYRGGYGGLYGGGMYGGGMYNSSFGGPMGGYGSGMGPFGDQDPNNPYGGPPSPPGFWISFLRVLFDRTGLLYGELARFALRLLGIKTRPRKVEGPRPNGLPSPDSPHGNQKYLEGPRAAPGGAWDNAWGNNASS